MFILSKKSIFYILFTLTIFLLGLSLYLYHASKLLAQEPIPQPPVECDDTSDTEYHSLRPYQASDTCVKSKDFATYCGNDLVLQDTVRGYYDSRDPDCREIVDGRGECS